VEQRLKNWHEVEGSNLWIHHQKKTMVNRQLEQKNIIEEWKNKWIEEKMHLEG
jgi:hypothetical protein